MAVAVVALIVALAGTAVAASHVNGGSLIKQSVGAGKLKKNTLTGFQINNQKLGTVPVASVANRASHTYWATVNNPTGAGNASLAHASDAGITAAEAGGGVVVTFPADVSGCANVAGKNNAATNTPTPGFAQTNISAANPAALEVRTRDDTGANVDGDFHVIVVCP